MAIPVKKSTVEKWSKHKTCKIHGLVHLMLPDVNHPSQTGLCGHPECIDKLISSLIKRRGCGGLIRLIRKLDRDNDFPSYIALVLLTEAKKGKPTVMNPTLMRWTCLDFLKKIKRRDDKEVEVRNLRNIVNHMLQQGAVENMQSFMTGRRSAIAGGFSYQRDTSPDKVLIFIELSEHIIEMFSVAIWLWLIGEISTREMCKIEEIKFADAPKMVQRVKKYYMRVF